MKIKSILAVLLTAVFLVPIFPAFRAQAEETAAFAIDERAVLQGMKRSYLQGYEPYVSKARNTMTLYVPITSEAAEGSIQAEIILPDDVPSPFPAQEMRAKAKPEDGLWPVYFKLELHEDRVNGDYPAILRVTGADKNSGSLSADIPYMFHIRDGAPSTEAMRLSLTELQSDLIVGEEGAISVLLANPCSTVAYEKITLRVSDTTGDVLPKEADTLYLPDLAPGAQYPLRIPVTVLANASVAPHSLKFEFSWTALNQPITQVENYTLPIAQEIRLEQGGISMPSTVVAGDSFTIGLPLMNMGRADVINVLVSASLPGITDRQSVLVGAIKPGDTKQAQITITTPKDAVGDYSGTLSVEGTDNDGNPAAFSLPVSLSLEKPAPTPSAEALDKKEAEPPLITLLLAGGCGLLLVIIILQGALLRRKIHRLEEDKL